MPPTRKNNKSRKASRKTTPKKAMSVMPRRRTPYGGYKSTTNSSKLIVKQESLGGQTANRLRLPPLTRPDSRARYIKAVSAASTFNKVRQFSMTSSETGLQAVSESPIAPQSQLRQIADSLANYLYSGSVSTATPVQPPARFLLQSVDDVYDFANRSSAPCSLKIYVCKAKRDTWYAESAPMIYNSPNGSTVSWDGTPEGAFRAGIQAQSVPFQSVAANNDWLNPGMLPTSSIIFNQYFDVEREIDVEMATGGVHQLSLHSYYDKVCDASVYANTPLVAVRGITRYLLLCATGNPVVIANQANMTTAQVDIGIIHTTKFKFTQSQAAVPVAFQDGVELEQTTSSSAIQINSGSGASSAVQTA